MDSAPCTARPDIPCIALRETFKAKVWAAYLHYQKSFATVNALCLVFLVNKNSDTNSFPPNKTIFLAEARSSRAAVFAFQGKLL